MPVSQQSGFTFPMIQKGPQGRLRYVRNDSKDLIQSSVLQILLTTPGERMWNPTFGCRIRQVQFEPSSAVFAETIVNLVLNALQKWEPRILVKSSDITVTYPTTDGGKTQVVISYRIISPDFTGNPLNTVTISI